MYSVITIQPGNWLVDKTENQYYTYLATEGDYILVDPILSPPFRRHHALVRPVTIDRSKISVCGFAQQEHYYLHTTREIAPVYLHFISPGSVKLRYLDKESAELFFIHEVQNAYLLLTNEMLEVNLTGI